MRTTLFAAGIWASLLMVTASAGAVPLLELSGRVALGDGSPPEGSTVRLKVDLDRDREFASYETLSGTVDESGAYVLRYELDPADVDLEFITTVAELVAEYEARGFEALLDDGPLPAIVSFEREGYSTVTRKIATLIENPNLDALLAPLEDIHCKDAGCQSSSGSVLVTGLPGGTGIARAYAEAYDPSLNTTRFPGSFSDYSGNLLISSGFMEIDFRDAGGKRVTRVSSPVEVRFEANPTSWPTLRDLHPDNDRIDLPMYSFDEELGEWVTEADGVLTDDDGAEVAESELAAINDGSYDGKLFVTFSTQHFSTWNCDRPIQTRACVKGRFVDELGNPYPGVSVSVQGVSYTGASATMMTGADGWFASDLMKSESEGEDIDGDGTSGQTVTAQVTAGGALGVYVGAAFDSPTANASIGIVSPECQPAACACLDLGDIVAEFERPRACRVTVKETYSGVSFTGDASVEAGDVVAGASVRGEYAGQVSIPLSASLEICDGVSCYSADVDTGGSASFVVPVIGETPAIHVSTEHWLEIDGLLHYYTGSITVQGCTTDEAELAAEVELELVHASLAPLGQYIAGLGVGPAPGEPEGGDDLLDAPDAPDPIGGSGCGCRAAGGNGPATPAWLALAVAFGLAERRRRWRR
jgi:MYXO-CTERM domain-containing protein